MVIQPCEAYACEGENEYIKNSRARLYIWNQVKAGLLAGSKELLDLLIKHVGQYLFSFTVFTVNMRPRYNIQCGTRGMNLSGIMSY